MNLRAEACESALAPLVRKLERLSPISDSDREALLSLPHKVRKLGAGVYLVRDGDAPEHVTVLLAGFAYRHKVTGDGARQIVSIHMRGDFVDLQNGLLTCADHNVQTLTDTEVTLVPTEAVRNLALQRPGIARAMWIDTLIDASIFREWVVNVGRRDSITRIAHLLCEFSLRLRSAGLANGHRYHLPMTQEQLADATGLTSVHVNRVLKRLGEQGLISRNGRSLTIEDWERMSRTADFNDRYLHHYAA